MAALKKFPIHELVQSGNVAELRRYIEAEKKKKRQVNLNIVDSENKTPLHVAVQTHRIDIVETLLAEHPDVTLKDTDGYTPLHIACSETGNEDIIRTLLRQPGLEINTGNRDSNTALHYFARYYSSPAAEPLFKGFIERGAKLDVLNSKMETPLHQAVFHKNIPVVGWLLQAGASPNVFAEKGDTPLHRAAMMDQLELVQMLLKAGANPNLTATPAPRPDQPVNSPSPSSMGRPIDLAKNPQIVARLKEAEQAQKRMAEMSEWLRAIGLEKYTPTFLKDEWDLDSISMIDEKMLINMGLPPAPRLRFLKEAKDRADKQRPKESPTAARASVNSAADSAAIIDAQRKQLGQNTIIDYKDLKMGDMLGKGFFAEVRRAEWCGCKVAVKIIYRESFKNKSDLELFYQEAEILSKLRFPNVVQFFGYCVGDHHCLVTEYMKEGSLYSLLHDHPEQVLGVPKVQLSICMDIAKGMNYLHSLRPPIVHRDLTSKNVLLGEHYIAKVADFGLSKEKDVTGTLTHSVGALPWAAPEVFRGEPYTEAADVYSYGIIVWETFTGQDPQGDVAPLQYAQKVAYENFRPPILPSIPPHIEELIKKCWDPKPTQRPTFEQISKMLKHLSKQKDKERRADRLKLSTTSVAAEAANVGNSPTPSSGSQASSLANSIAAVPPHSADADLLAQYGGNPAPPPSAATTGLTSASSTSSSPSPANSLAGSNKVNARVFQDDGDSSSSSSAHGRNSPAPVPAVLDVYMSNPALSTQEAPKLENKSQSMPSMASQSDEHVSSTVPSVPAPSNISSESTHRASLKNSSLRGPGSGSGDPRADLLMSKDKREKKAKKEKKSHRPSSVLVNSGLTESADDRKRDKKEKKEKKEKRSGTSERAVAPSSPAALTGSGNPAVVLTNSNTSTTSSSTSSSLSNSTVASVLPTIAVSDRSVPSGGIAGGGSGGDVSSAQARQQQLHMYHQFAFKPAAKSPKPGLSLSQKASAAAIGGADYHKDESKDSDEDASST